MAYMDEESKSVVVSVVMPAYNAELYIKQAIQSIQDQSYDQWELIIVNDCSTDNTHAIAKEISDRDHRVHVYSNEVNQGVAQSRNYGIALAKGKYIALIDSDDIWATDKLERQIALAESTKAQIVYCSYDFIDEQGLNIKKPFLVPDYTDFNKMLIRSVISCSTGMFDARLLKQHKFEPEYYHEDYVLWMKLLAIPVRAIGDKKILAHYRQVTGSRSANKANAAKQRWITYRKVLKLGYFKSAWAFLGYSVLGVIKYYF